MTADIRATIAARRSVIRVRVSRPAEIPAQLVPVLVGNGNGVNEPDVNFLALYLLARG